MINSPNDLRQYWTSKYEERFDSHYKSKNFGQDFILLKRLWTKYDKYLLLEAIDRFLSSERQEYCSINFFGAQKVFTRKFEDLIKIQPIIKYKRFLNTYPEDINKQVKELIQEYLDYVSFERISESEKGRKEKIVEELEQTTNEFFAD